MDQSDITRSSMSSAIESLPRASTAKRALPAQGGHVLVLGDYRQTVTVVRSLARAGYRVTLGTNDSRSSTALSLHVSGVCVIDESNRERYLDLLEAWIKRENPDYVFPVGETQSRRIASAAERFMPLSTWVMPHPATVLRCLDKRALYELTPTLGIPTAPWCRYAGLEDWTRAAGEMGFPVVIKLKDSTAYIKGKKAVILHAREALDAFLCEAQSEPDVESMMMQKFAAGARHNCHVAADSGRIVAFFQQKVLRTDELDGTGIGIEGVAVPVSPLLRTYCDRLVGALGYHGLACIQFLVDEKLGTIAFLEVNPRMDSTAALPYRLGYDYPRLAVEIAAGRAPVPLTRPYRTGKHYHWLHGDMLSWNEARKQRGQSAMQLIGWAVRMLGKALTSHHLTWDARDPAPTLHLFWKEFYRVLQKRLRPALRPLQPMP